MSERRHGLAGEREPLPPAPESVSERGEELNRPPPPFVLRQLLQRENIQGAFGMHSKNSVKVRRDRVRLPSIRGQRGELSDP